MRGGGGRGRGTRDGDDDDEDTDKELCNTHRPACPGTPAVLRSQTGSQLAWIAAGHTAGPSARRPGTPAGRPAPATAATGGEEDRRSAPWERQSSDKAATKQRQSSDKAATKQRAPPPRLLRTHLQVPGPLLPVLRGDRRVLGTVQQRQLAAVHVEAAGAAPRSRRVKRRFTAYRPYVDPGRISTAIQRRFEEIRRDSQQRKGRLCARAAKQRQVLPVHRSTCLCVSLRATIWMFATTHSTQFSNRIGSDQSSREWNQVLGAPGRGRSVRAGTHRQSMSSSQLTSGSYLHRTTRDPL